METPQHKVTKQLLGIPIATFQKDFHYWEERWNKCIADLTLKGINLHPCKYSITGFTLSSAFYAFQSGFTLISVQWKPDKDNFICKY
jgi:hypothetical protein